MEIAFFRVFIYEVILLKKNKELQHLKMCKIRDALFTDVMKKRFYTLIRGYDGELVVYISVDEFGNPKWYVLTDYWFNVGNRNQADLIIITDSTWIVVEVKNYDGHFVYRNNQASLNGHVFNDDIMTQMSNRVRKIQRIADELNQEINVVGSMVFVNENCTVELDRQFDFDIVMSNELRKYIQDLRHNHPATLDLKYLGRVKQQLAQYQTESPFTPQPFTEDALQMMRKGITCADCHSFNTVASYKKIRCRSCGHTENKSTAVIRSAKQLRMLYFDKPEMITRKNVHAFIGGVLSNQGTKKILSKHFKVNGSGTNYHYEVDIDWE